MSRRSRRLTVVLGGLVVLLFVGRWTATWLTDRWWAAELVPPGGSFITDWHLLRFALDLTGCLVASGWFIGNLLLVYRAVGTVQVRRNVANLEFREALTPRALLTVVIVAGVLLGLLVGSGASNWWSEVMLAWQGVSYGATDPLLGRDLGLYLAQLPLWRALHGFAMLLVLLALTGVTALYLLVGAIRWIDRRPAINQHARSHLGWLLAALALVLAWGYLLKPYQLVAGPAGLLDQENWSAALLASPILAGIALATAIFSAVWAARPRHALLVAGWLVLAAASTIGVWLLPSFLDGTAQPVLTQSSLERLSRLAYGLEELEESRLQPVGEPAPPRVPSLWNAAALAQSFPGDSAHLLAVDPTLLTPGARRRPAWLVIRSAPSGRVSAAAIADNRVSPSGEPLFYRLGDTLLKPVPTPLLDLPADFLRPDAVGYRLRDPDGPGVTVDGWPRRVLLAWALQSGELLGEVGSRDRVDWRLSPEDRLQRLVPYAEWGAPLPRIIEGELVWLVDGYIASSSFPLTGRVEWRNREVGSVRAAFLGTVNAESGATRVYLQPGVDPLAATWASLSQGVIEPATAIPETVLRAAPYPPDLFRVQVKQLEQAPWRVGSSNRRSGRDNSDEPRPNVAWGPDTSGPLITSTFELPGERRISAVVTGSRHQGKNRLTLVHLDSAATLAVPSTLEDRWDNFPSYDALSDSIREDGGKLTPGPVRIDLSPGGAVAYQAYFALRPSGGTVLAWVSVAAPNRLGAGRTLQEAWSNLLGATVPSPPGSAQAGRLDEARHWMEQADSALKAGAWSEFGRAWNNLREVLGLSFDTTGS